MCLGAVGAESLVDVGLGRLSSELSHPSLGGWLNVASNPLPLSLPCCLALILVGPRSKWPQLVIEFQNTEGLY